MNNERSPAPETDAGPSILLGDFTLLLEACVLLHKGEPSNLGRRAVAVLRELAKRPGEVVTKKHLLREAWVDASGRRAIVEEGSLAVQIHSLRQVLGKEAIKTVMDRGYRLMLPVGLPPIQNHHFPVPVSVEILVGRERDEADLKQLVKTQRITTLLGGPGVGKTSLASMVAGQLAVQHTSWLELAPLADEESIIRLLAAAARVRLTGEVSIDALATAMESVSGLFVLDNAEHVLPMVARLCATVLSRTQGVAFFVTSQAPLNIAGEKVHLLTPLALPPEGADVQAILDSPAVALFLRIADRGHSEQSFEWPLAEVVHIVRMLAGNPLAIHHVASHAQSLDPASLGAAWDSLFLLSSADPTLPQRHRTLADAFDWSCNLLRPEALLVFHAVARFPAGVDISLLPTIAKHLQLDPQVVQEAIRELIDRSFVFWRPYSQRLMIPEAARHYARRREQQGGGGRELDNELLNRCLVNVVLALARAGLSTFLRIDHHRWQARYQPEWENLRVALDTARQLDLPDEILFLSMMCWYLWIPDGRVHWGSYLANIVTPALVARASPDALIQYRLQSALTLLDGGLRELLETPGAREQMSRPDPCELATTLAGAAIWFAYSDPDYSEDCFVEALNLTQNLTPPAVVQSIMLQASIYRLVASGELRKALDDADHALALADASPIGSRGFTLLMAVHAALAFGDVGRLEQHWNRTHAQAQPISNRQRVILLTWFAHHFAESGKTAQLNDALQGFVSTVRTVKLGAAELQILDPLASVALQQGDESMAARITVRSDLDHAAHGRVRDRVLEDIHTRLIGRLSPASLEAARADVSKRGKTVSTAEILMAAERWASRAL